MSINFIELIDKGCNNEFDRDNLTNYFYREFKRAEKDFYEADSFFDGCIKGINAIEKAFIEEIEVTRIRLKGTIERFQRIQKLLISGQKNPGYYNVEDLNKEIRGNHNILSDTYSEHSKIDFTSTNIEWHLSKFEI